jgi:hypothetical protein
MLAVRARPTLAPEKQAAVNFIGCEAVLPCRQRLRWLQPLTRWAGRHVYASAQRLKARMGPGI